MKRLLIVAALAAWMLAAMPSAARAVEPVETVRAAEQVLNEMMAIPARRIPETLLSEAQGVVIVPNVIKIGFVAGARRGHGVVLVRDAEGRWSLPQFVTLTGGSLGWQAGIQGTDVVLVFTTKKSVEGLMQGKFTIGADASAAAGPVGRNAAAATDARLKAEILSYSRSRGLFLGVAIDGSALEIDHAAHAQFYGSPSTAAPAQVPEPAARLCQALAQFAGAPAGAVAPVAYEAGPIPAVAAPAGRADALRQQLAQNATQLQGLVDPAWQRFLALPKEVFEPGPHPGPELLQPAVRNYDRVAGAAEYRALARRAEFQSTYKLLRDYNAELATAARPAVDLPPPPELSNSRP